MANTAATTNVAATWVCGGSSDTLTCAVCDQQSRAGVQIEANGFNLEDATVTVTAENGAAKVVTAPADSGEIALFGSGFSIASIQISGVTAGTYVVTFRQ